MNLTKHGKCKQFCIMLVCLLMTAAQPITGISATSLSNTTIGVSQLTQQAQTMYNRLPLYFIPDASNSNYIAWGAGVSLVFTAQGIVMAMEETRLQVDFIGANPSCHPVGSDPGNVFVNDYTGNARSQWREHVPAYQHLIYPDVYPNIDLIYSGNNGEVEYTFVVQPGGDVNEIRLAYRGNKSLTLDPSGKMLIHLLNGKTLYESAPYAYQWIDGQSVPVQTIFQLYADNTYGFAVSNAVRSDLPLVIDPVVGFSTYLGGSQNDEGWAIALDKKKNIYVTGISSSDHFINSNTYSPANTYQNVFVAKINAAGNALVYVTFLSGSEDEESNSITVDTAGNAYLTGPTWSPDFPTTPSVFQSAFGGREDAWVAKLDSTGRLVFSTYLGGSDADESYDIVVDSGGYVYVIGETYSTNFPILNAMQPNNRGSEDIFITKLTPHGSAMVFSTYIGTVNHDEGVGIALDDANNIYATGDTWFPGFQPTVGVAQSFFGGGERDAFVLKLSADGQTLIYFTYLGGDGVDEGYGIIVDKAGNAYVAGYTSSRTFPVVDPVQMIYGGGPLDAFVTKLNPSGTAWIYSTYLGGAGRDYATGLDVNSKGEVFVTGGTESVDFPTTGDAWQPHFNGGWRDGFVTDLSATGNSLVYSTFLGGSDDDEGGGIAVDDLGNVFVSGSSLSSEFRLVAPLQPVNAGGYDAFIVRLDFAASIITPTLTPEPVVKTIGPEGGVVWQAYAGHLTLIESPPGNWAEPVTVTIHYDQRSNNQGAFEGIDHFFTVETVPSSSVLAPVNVTLAYAGHFPIVQDTLGLYRLVAGNWVTDGITLSRIVPGAILAQIEPTGSFGLLGQTQRFYLPLILRK